MASKADPSNLHVERDIERDDPENPSRTLWPRRSSSRRKQKIRRRGNQLAEDTMESFPRMKMKANLRMVRKVSRMKGRSVKSSWEGTTPRSPSSSYLRVWSSENSCYYAPRNRNVNSVVCWHATHREKSSWRWLGGGWSVVLPIRRMTWIDLVWT